MQKTCWKGYLSMALGKCLFGMSLQNRFDLCSVATITPLTELGKVTGNNRLRFQ